MSENSLVSLDRIVPESREEAITRQFYDWELRGRGWRVGAYPVELEPPFRPIYFFDPGTVSTVDDGRVPTFLSRLFAGSNSNPPATQTRTRSHEEFRERLAELDEPLLCEYFEEDFGELQIVFATNQKVTKATCQQLLSSMNYCSNPISFEIVGTSDEIIVQFAATERDLIHVGQQLSAFFPEAFIRKTNGHLLENAWETGEGHPLIVDFGLSNEFMIPIDVVSSLESDPLVSIVGALSDLSSGEIGIFQVLFQKAKADWATEIMDSVRSFDGTPFFANAPDMIPLAKRKLGSPLFASVIRVAAKGTDKDRSWQIVRSLGAGLSQLSNPTSNELIPLSNDDYSDEYHEQALVCRLSFRCGMILNLEELVSLVHPPSQGVRSTKLTRTTERTKAAPVLALGHNLILGENEHQNEVKNVTLSAGQRTKHIHVIGSSGSGKSTLLLNLICQDLEQNQGLCVMDPHGDLIDAVIENVPDHRKDNVIVFDPSDSEYPIGFNILQAKSELEKTILSSDLVATFRRMSTSWGDVMDSVLANALLAFIESERGGTLFELKRFLVERDFRNEFLGSVPDEGVRYFWENEFPLISGKPQSSILIRLDAFLRQRLIRNIVCQRESKLDFRSIIDDRKVLLIKLSQGLIGEENAYLLGSMLVSRLYQTAMGSQDSNKRPYFWLYLDEFQHFITPSMEGILSGARKYHLGLTLAHQEFRQLQSRSQEVASSVLSNCYTRICFRLGDYDAEKLASGFSSFDSTSLLNLGVGEAVGRIERADYDFNLQVSKAPSVHRGESEKKRMEIVSSTRKKFARSRSEVESEFQMARPTAARPVPATKTKFPKDAIFIEGSQDRRQEVQPQSSSVDERPIPGAAVFDEQKSVQRTQQHQYLQSLIKRMGENKGFRVTIEKEVFGGVGKIDVSLEDETRKIACEVSVTNEPDYEIQNIRKCISADYKPVIMISADTRHLENIRKKAGIDLTAEHFAITKFFTPEEFFSWLDGLDTVESKGEERVKGFKVKVNVKPMDRAEQSTRKKAISDVVFGALKRLKK